MLKGVEPSYNVLEQRRQGLLKKMAKVGPFIMATPSYVKAVCGNPDCKCARNKKDRHEKLHLSWADREGYGSAYVPVDLREEVIRWVENYWEIKELMKEMTAISRKMIKMYAKTLGAHKRRMAKEAKKKII